MNVHVTKTVPITFKMVVDGYQKVRQGGKAADIDNESWEIFDKDVERTSMLYGTVLHLAVTIRNP